MMEIFPNLVDSVCIDCRIIMNFPPKYGESIFDKNGNYVGIDSTKATNEQKKELADWNKRNLEIENDTSKIVIAFDPKIKPIKENIEDDFAKHFNGARIFKNKTESKLEYTLDLEKIVLKNKFKLKHINEFPNRNKIWQTEYDFNFSGVLFFTRIQFDKDKKNGILDGAFSCGGKCGQGFRIYIKKTKEKWIIDEVEGTWIS